MQNADYAEHLGILGKFIFNYDNSVADKADLESLAGATFAQISQPGDETSWPADKLLNQYTGRFQDAIASGPTALISLATAMATTYLESDIFRSTLTTTPTAATAKASLEALITDMGLDSKTFTTSSSTGIIHFFAEVFDPVGTFPHSGSPTYADATYVTADVVGP